MMAEIETCYIMHEGMKGSGTIPLADYGASLVSSFGSDHGFDKMDQELSTSRFERKMPAFVMFN